jgi:TonB-linked SusC/RagA family outer membrane protein
VRSRQTPTRKEAALPPVENFLPPMPIDVSGKVSDEDGNPLMGASVKVKGTNNGTTTNAEGLFLLKAVDEDATLEIEFVGFAKQTMPLQKRKTINFSLKRNSNPLDEVIIKAYGTETKRFTTSNTGTIKAEDIEKQPINNPLLALQGRVTGLIITPGSGVPGASIKIRIQGQNSINSGNDPLIVVDGVPYPSQNFGPGSLSSILGGSGSALSYINPTDIESMDVLKDADATAIYGSRAANGAILITTKKGKMGSSIVNVDFQQGWSKAVSHMDLLNSQQYMGMRREAKKNDNAAILTADFDLRGVWDTTRYTDWQKVLIGNTAKYTRATVGVSGGTTNIQYLVSGTYGRQTSNFPGDYANNKSSLHFSINGSSNNQRFRIQLSGSYLVDKNDLPVIDLSSFIVLAPVAPNLFNTDGTLNWAPDPLTGASTWNNPMTYLYSFYENKGANLISNAVLSYRILPGLEIKSNIGYTSSQIDEFTANLTPGQKPEFLASFATNRSSSYANSSLKSWIIEPQLNYNKSFRKMKFNLLVGGSFQQRDILTSSLTGTGYSSDLLIRSIRAATTVSVNNYYASSYKYAAGFARATLNMSDKYLFNLTARRDGSSRFGSENKFHSFGALGAGWIFSQANLIKERFKWLSFGKLSGSYGTTGNDQIPDYRYYSLYSSTGSSTMPYQGTGTGLNLNGISNPYLQWEETQKLQAGLDLGFLQDRVLFNISFSNNRSSNQLLQYNLPSITGVGNITTNFPALVQNTTWEFSLNTQNIKTKNFSWKSNINLTIARNKLIEFPELNNSSYASSLIVGEPIGFARTYPFYGVNPSNGLYLVTDYNGNPTSSPDFNKDNNFILDATPRFYGGFLNTIEFAGFQLDVFCQFSNQNGTYVLRGGTSAPGAMSVTGLSNQPVSVLNRWQRPGDITTEAKFTTTTSTLSNVGSRTWGDASYIRLKNASVSYKFSDRTLRKLHVQNAKLFCSAQNLFTLTKFIGLDPETGGTGFLPPLRTITLGFQMTL